MSLECGLEGLLGGYGLGYETMIFFSFSLHMFPGLLGFFIIVLAGKGSCRDTHICYGLISLGESSTAFREFTRIFSLKVVQRCLCRRI